MAKFINDSVNWFRRSLTEHDAVRQTKSAPVSQQMSQDSTGSAYAEDVDGDVAAPATSAPTSTPAHKLRSTSAGGLPPPLVSPASLDYPPGGLDGDEADLMPELEGGQSSILRDDEILKLCDHLPPRLVGSPWSKVFSTDRDGFSLNNIYRKMDGLSGVPTLLAVRDVTDRRFGALVSDSFRIQETFYGTGESFLFALAMCEDPDGDDNDSSHDDISDDFRVYKWSTDNSFFIACSQDALCIGAEDGRFGLSLDGDLNHGRTDRCATYRNEPLTPGLDFQVKTVEVWTFG